MKTRLEHWFSNCSLLQNHLEGLLKQLAGSHARVSDSLGLGCGPRIYISNQFQGDADTAGPGITL